MKRFTVLVLLAGVGVLSCGGCAAKQTKMLAGQQACVFEKRMVVTQRLDYLLYTPQDYATSREKWPLVLFLHGAGERGSDLAKVAKHGLPAKVAAGESFPFLLVAPQCPAGDWWETPQQVEMLNLLLDDIVSRYRVDKDRIYLTGLSMGGDGAWALAAKYPGRFAALVPICGGGDPKWAQRLSHIPVWVFHGAKDDVVPIARSEEMVAALKAAGGDVQFTVYPETGHGSWGEAYNTPELYKWLMSQRRINKQAK